MPRNSELPAGAPPTTSSLNDATADNVPATNTTAITLSLDLGDRGLARRIAGLLQELVIPTPDALTLFENGPDAWRIDSYYTEAVDTDALHQRLVDAVEQTLPRFTITKVPDENWVELSQAALPAVVAGRFTVHGSHDCQRIARGPNSILIDAGEAFGTAHHATTFGCLQALDTLTRRLPDQAGAIRNCLDLGCGSGVLAIALTRALPQTRIVASDLDPQSVVVAAQNIRLNGAHRQITTVSARGTDHPVIRRRAPFDLVMANILAGPLIELSADIRRVVKSGGTLVLSGLLISQAASIIATYHAHGFYLVHHARIEGWSTLTLQRR